MKGIKSMTGYGKAEKIIENKKITIEVRALNSKQTDVNFRSPQVFKALEFDLRRLVSSIAARGKFDIVLTQELLGGETAAVFNGAAFKSYFLSISKTMAEIGLDTDRQEIVSAILRLPEVLIINNEELDESEINAVTDCCSDALKSLNIFRLKEGSILIEDILFRISNIEDRLKQIEPYEKERIEKIRESVMSNLNSLDLTANIDKNRFEQELIYYLEKMDITEEKVRLAQHCAFFRQTVDREDMPGRKLGFIAQEIGREINTIGSKAGEVNIQKLVVEMKDELEKIKEQLLNIL
ncbi:MAG: YicC family protein [Prevotellaceae bacterium]|nr:YicC family protein [Prevotellaceae bacterium]